MGVGENKKQVTKYISGSDKFYFGSKFKEHGKKQLEPEVGRTILEGLVRKDLTLKDKPD